MSESEKRAEPMKPPTTNVGDRIRLVCHADEWSPLLPGTLGAVRFIDSLGTIHVDWDDGSKLGLVFEAGDRWEVMRQ